MNKRPLRQCKALGCTALTRDKTGYCEDHTGKVKERSRERYKNYNKYTRDKDTTRFYNGKAWTDARGFILSIYNGIDVYAYYTSREVVIANTVHHIIELKEDWSKRLDIDNLMPVSSGSHDEIHRLYLKDKKGTQELLFEMLERYKKEFNINL